MVVRLTRSVKVFLILCFCLFILIKIGNSLFDFDLLEIFSLSFFVFRSYQFWQFLTYPFIHSDGVSLFFNLLVVAFVGSEVESVLGTRSFLKYMCFCILNVGFFFLGLSFLMRLNYESFVFLPLFGASGIIYALLVAYAYYFGERVLLLMMIFPIKAKHLIWVLGSLELVTTLSPFSDRTAGLSQLYAGGISFFYFYFFKRRPKKNRLSYLTCISNDVQQDKRNDFRLISHSFQAQEEDTGDSSRTWH